MPFVDHRKGWVSDIDNYTIGRLWVSCSVRPVIQYQHSPGLNDLKKEKEEIK